MFNGIEISFMKLLVISCDNTQVGSKDVLTNEVTVAPKLLAIGHAAKISKKQKIIEGGGSV